MLIAETLFVGWKEVDPHGLRAGASVSRFAAVRFLTLPGLRDNLSLSWLLAVLSPPGIPFRTVILFSRCGSSMNYHQSTRKNAIRGILRELHFDEVYTLEIAFLQFRSIMIVDMKAEKIST